MKEKNVAAILKLSAIQEALLIHNLHSQEDQGLIITTAQLSGSLNPELFQKAWNQVVAKHGSSLPSLTK